MNKGIIKELIKKYGSPLYIYDENILRDRCNQMIELKNNLESDLKVEINMHYSLKSNNNPTILKIIKETGLYVDSMSPLELDICKKCGFNNSDILYVCNNVSKEEMNYIHDNNILVCLDSVSQVDTWGQSFPNTDIMVRINPGITGVGHNDKVVTSGKNTKFGISENSIKELFEVTNKYNLNIVGIHQHLGSLFLDDKIDEYINGVSAGLEIIKKYFRNISIIDLGGGFGVPYKDTEKPLDLNKVEIELKKILKPFLSDIPSIKEIKFEPGRYIPCESGFLAGTVTSVKNEYDTYWIGTDIGMNQLVRPSMYDAYHKIEVISENNKEITANICGNICESGDILGKDRKVLLPEVGDSILVYNVGAYGYSMASNYTGRPRPAEILLSNDKDKLIRNREEISDLEKNIIW